MKDLVREKQALFRCSKCEKMEDPPKPSCSHARVVAKINWQEIVESGLEGGSNVISTRRAGVGFSLRARRVLGHYNLQQAARGFLLALSCFIYNEPDQHTCRWTFKFVKTAEPMRSYIWGRAFVVLENPASSTCLTSFQWGFYSLFFHFADV